METNRQYVACAFRPGDRRTYTYHNDGEPVAVGDEIKVADRNGDGRQRVTVMAIGDEKPKFETKPILGKAPPRDPEPETLDPITASGGADFASMPETF